ncbi:hypothetical protein [Umezawaea sp. Da 62-37]|uniref:hypothetical protein n=1 Tax=Umezawaea sp. Da 62-37 TaxID=3075927 RepID=UPI0028F6EEEE|nr:hypothetical protein [Umezawaea sp. Da 62-37]WNV84951.1 hypothetical protein RM788_43485 [Umezawaea sp. Da 62-37]
MSGVGDRCLRLALIAAFPLGFTIGWAMSASILEALIVGALGVVLWVLATAGRNVWSRGRRLHLRTGHWVLTAVGLALPTPRAFDWAEEMHAQLLELSGWPRRRFLIDFILYAPRNWTVAWWARSQHARALRYRGNELHLVRRLYAALAPYGELTDRMEILHAAGLSRLQSRLSARQVPALVLARNLLSTRSQVLGAAREHAHALLSARERAHLISRDLRRNHLAAWLRDHQIPYAHQYAELAQLRHTVELRSELLRKALAQAASTYRTARHRRSH